MDMSPYDPDEVARFWAAPNDLNARSRFARHVHERCPTHPWPNWFWAQCAAEPGERSYYLDRAIEAAEAQLVAESSGTATRRQEPVEATIHRRALRDFAEWLADEGEPNHAARTVARLLELDPADRLGALDMAGAKGVFSARAAEAAAGLRM